MAVRPYKIKRPSPLLQLATGALSAKLEHEKGLRAAEEKKALLEFKKRELDIKEAQNKGILSQQEAELEYQKAIDAQKLKWEQAEFKATEAGKAWKAFTDRLAEARKDKREHAQEIELLGIKAQQALELQEAGGEVTKGVESFKKELGATTYQAPSKIERAMSFVSEMLKQKNIASQITSRKAATKHEAERIALEKQRIANQEEQFDKNYQANQEEFSWDKAMDMFKFIEDRVQFQCSQQTQFDLAKYKQELSIIVNKPLSYQGRRAFNEALYWQHEALRTNDKRDKKTANAANETLERILEKEDNITIKLPRLEYEYKPSLFHPFKYEVTPTSETTYERGTTTPRKIPEPTRTGISPQTFTPFEGKSKTFIDNLSTDNRFTDNEDRIKYIEDNKEELKKKLELTNTDIDLMILWLRSQ